MTRQTSIEAYNQIKENGLLTGLQFKVYDALYHYGPATQQELWFRCFKETQARNIMPRFAELQRLGVIDSLQKKPCDISGRNCMVWDVTDRLPAKPQPKQTKDQIIKELKDKVNAMEAQIMDLNYRVLRDSLF